MSHSWLAVLGLCAAIVPLRGLWPRGANATARGASAAIVVLVLGLYSLYLVYEEWWFLRFLLPVFPFVGLGMMAIVLTIARRVPALVALTAVGVMLTFVGVFNIRAAARLDVLGSWKAERRYPDVAARVREVIDPNSVVLAMIHSGSLRYYAGVPTLRSDSIDPDWLDRAVAWLASRGVRSYALLEAWEVSEFLERFKGQQIAANLDRHAVWLYRGARTIGLYDLTQLATASPGEIPARDPWTLRAVPPAPPPVLTLR